MKITNKNQLGLLVPLFAGEIAEAHKAKYLNNGIPKEGMDCEKSLSEINSLLSQDRNKNYLFKQSAMIIAERIKADKLLEENFSFLNRVKEGKKLTYLINEKCFYRWERVGAQIRCIYVEMAVVNGSLPFIKYNLWKFNLDSGVLSYPEQEYDEVFEATMMRFVRLLIFTELSELELVTLAPERSIGARRDGKYVNETKSDIVIVDSTWNKMIFRTTGFAVSGHLRLQRHGKGRNDVKLIYIEEFEKHGYVRKAKSNIYKDPHSGIEVDMSEGFDYFNH